MSRIRVVFSIGAMHGGGSERQILTVLKHLDRSAFEPFLYLIYRDGPLLPHVPDDVPIAAFSERTRPGMHYLPGQAHRQRVLDMARFLTEVNADVSYDRTFLMTLIAADAAQRSGIPNVSTIVTNPETGFAPVAGRFQWYKRRLLHRLYERSASVVAVSEGVADAAARFYHLRRDRIHVIANGVDVEAVCQMANEHPVEHPGWNAAQESCVRVVTAGRLDERKGFHVLIDAVSRLRHRDLPAIRLAILGEGPERCALERQIAEHNLQEFVFLPGFQANAAAWYKSADLFVLPSLVEGMPNVLLEAMAVGTPVVSTDCPSGPAEILQRGELGTLVEVNNSESLADGIAGVLKDLNGAQATAECAANVVKTQRSATTAVRHLEDRLRACLAST
jgi:glycosyltransferase involved in cell wall biosynthesis